ncbi:MAG TPA: cytochrome P450 [Jatrophihabitantaceae bacterium]|nr:cytochrome P450 [Jatrophihabitantaceae bacterium]
MTGLAPPRVRGGLPWFGHMLSYGRNPYEFVAKVAAEHGEIASFVMLGQRIVLLTGAGASDLFYRSPDELLDQSAAYKVMTPIFGEGLLYDATPQRKDEQLAMLVPPLRGDAMRDHAPKISREVRHLTSAWGASGRVDAVTFMQELTINTATACLLGPELRYEVNAEFVQLYHDLERAVSPLAYSFPNLPLPKFRRRDAARRRLQEIVGDIVRGRRADPTPHTDLLQTLLDMRYADGSPLTETEIAGILIGATFAGHHTSAGTAAWLLIELLRHPDLLAEARAEVDGAGEPTFESVRELPILDAALKEVLRLHPPIAILMRKVMSDLSFGEYTIAAGDLVWVSPPVSHRLSEHFPGPDRFEPTRFSAERREDRSPAYQPFGGGKHRCMGSGFAAFQIKVIFAELLRRYDFELVAAPSDYVDDYTQMIVQPKRPSLVAYRHRDLD